MNAGHEHVRRTVVDLLRRADLLQAPADHHRDPVAERHRLHLVVRDVDGRDAEPVVQLLQLGAHLHAQLRVQVRQRLVQQEHLRLAHERAAHRHALALAARQLPRPALQQVGSSPSSVAISPTRASISSFGALRCRKREPEVLLHGHVRVQRVVLEHHRDVAVLRRDVVHARAADA